MAADESSQAELIGNQRHPNATELLTTLALINVTWEVGGKSYLDNFVPFVVEAVRSTGKHDCSEQEAQAALVNAFGLAIPSRVVGSLLRRATHQGLTVRKDNRYALTSKGQGSDAPADAAARAECRRQQRSLASALSTMVSSRFELEWTTEQAEEALAAYIEQHAVPLLAASTSGVALEPLVTQQGTEYIVSLFISEIADRQAELFKYLDQMVKGSMLASALYVSVQADVTRRFSNTTLFLDAPICLKALGLEGDEAKDAARQVIAMAIGQGASIACFEHSLKEMIGILDVARGMLKSSPRRSDEMGVVVYLRDIGATPSDVELILERLEHSMSSVGIRIEPLPPYETYLGVDEAELERRLQDGVGYLRHPSLVTDLNSLTAIHRLRQGRAPRQLERCRAILITDNDRLSAVGRNFFDRKDHEWPVVMLENDLAALVWVKEPQRYPDLPKSQVIADCYAALSPSPIMWQRVSAEIARLQNKGSISEGDVAILRYSHEASTAIMDTTLGEPSRVNEPAIQKILAQAKEAASKPVTRERDSALERAVAAEAREASLEHERQALIADQAIAKGESEEAITILSAQIEGMNKRDLALRARVMEQAQVLGRRIRGCLLATAVLITLFGAASLFPEVAAIMSGPTLMLARIAAVLALTATIFGTVTDWSSRVEHLVAAWDEGRRLRNLGLHDL